jgi:hypothetical protein
MLALLKSTIGRKVHRSVMDYPIDAAVHSTHGITGQSGWVPSRFNPAFAVTIEVEADLREKGHTAIT